MKILTMIFFLSFLVSCKNDLLITPTVPSTPKEKAEEIKGLELTYLRTNLTNVFNAIFFIDETIGYIAGYKGAIYKTNNGSISWIEQITNTTVTINDIYFLNINEGFAVGGAEIIHTIDGGMTWNKIPMHITEQYTELNSIYFATDSVGFAVGSRTILSTKNRGVSWKETKMNNLGGSMKDVNSLMIRRASSPVSREPSLKQ